MSSISIEDEDEDEGATSVFEGGAYSIDGEGDDISIMIVDAGIVGIAVKLRLGRL